MQVVQKLSNFLSTSHILKEVADLALMEWGYRSASLLYIKVYIFSTIYSVKNTYNRTKYQFCIVTFCLSIGP